MPKRVLVIDAIATHRIRYAAVLEAARYDVDTLALQSHLSFDPRAYDIVLVGAPTERLGHLISSVAKAVQGTRTPILCMDNRCSPLRRLLALGAGARDVLPSKSPDDLMLALVRSLIRQAEAEREADRRRLTATSFGFSEASTGFEQPARLLIAGALGRLPDNLSTLLPHDVVWLPAGADLQDHVAAYNPDAVILELGDDGRSARNALADLRDQTHLSPIPILAVYSADHAQLAADALVLGAIETVLDTASLEEFELRIATLLTRKAQDDALRRAHEQSYRMAATDALTGLYNRRYAETYLTGLLSNNASSPADFSVLIVDIDHFKSVNDTFGHAAGDAVLREIAARLQDNLRACDLVARYGGEEFLVVLAETSCATATLLAERLRCAIASRAITLAGGRRS